MKFFLMTMVILWSSTMLAAECDYKISIANATLQIEDSAQVVQQSFTVNRGQNSPAGRCRNYRVFFSKGLANSYQRNAFSLFNGSINYNLHPAINMAGTLKDYADAVTASEYIEGSAPEKNTIYTNRFFVSVPGQNNNLLLSGTYVDIVQVSIYGYNENSGKYLFDETANLTAVFYVPKKVQVSILDEGQAFDASSTSKTMDFGIMEQNQEKGADLRILSNGSYRLNLSSLNNGKMVQGSSSVAYSLRVNGSAVALTSSATNPVQIGTGTITGQAGHLYNLKVKITESVANKNAGLYQDVITITAIAN
jgi:hypothetical protein